MEQFLISFIFTAISFAFIMSGFILVEKKKRKKFLETLDKKKSELLSTIDDAEEMLEELNKFSDYIVNLLEQKKDEVEFTKVDVEVAADKYAEDVLPEKQLHKEVLKLVEQGMSCEEVARVLNRGKGEIQLIIDMKKYY